MKVRWEGDNLAAVQKLVAAYGAVQYHDLSRKSLRIVAREFVRQDGGVERMQDAESMVVELGDTIHRRAGVDGITDSVGIERAPDQGDDGEIVWTGENPFDVAMFVRKHDLAVSINDRDLILKEGAAAKRAQAPHGEARRASGVLTGTDNFIRMRCGDKLMLKGGKLFMSRAGRDHRV